MIASQPTIPISASRLARAGRDTRNRPEALARIDGVNRELHGDTKAAKEDLKKLKQDEPGTLSGSN